MKKDKLFTNILLAAVISFGGLAVSLPVIAAEPPVKTAAQTRQSVTGSITDGINNVPLKDVYVKQMGTLNTVLSDQNGNFILYTENSGENKLLINKENYEPVQVNFTPGQNINVKLFPVRGSNQGLPSAHTPQEDILNYVPKPLGSSFSGFYQARYQAQRVPTLDGTGASVISGLAVNEVALNGQIRLDEWLGSFKVFKSRYPINVENFPYNPAYNLNLTQIQIGGGKVFPFSEKMDLYAGLSYLLHFQDPDNRGGSENKPIPYTNSFNDFPQTRQGPGVTGMFGYFLNEFITINGNATLYPVLFTTIGELQGNGPGYHGMLDFGINAKVETLPGIYLTGGYTNQFVFGFSGLLEDANLFMIGISLDPFEMANISATGADKVTNGR